MNYTPPEYAPNTYSLPIDDPHWQQTFKLLQKTISLINISPDELYPEDPTYSQFLEYILEYIRSGGKDICFKPEHIIDLLKYEPTRLRTRWSNKHKHFCVWLEN